MSPSDTYNPAAREAAIRRAQKAITEEWEAAMDVGCMEHGGYRWLAEAATAAVLEFPVDHGVGGDEVGA